MNIEYINGNSFFIAMFSIPISLSIDFTSFFKYDALIDLKNPFFTGIQ